MSNLWICNTVRGFYSNNDMLISPLGSIFCISMPAILFLETDPGFKEKFRFECNQGWQQLFFLEEPSPNM